MRSIFFFLRPSRSILFFLWFFFFNVGTAFTQPVIRGKVTGRDGMALSGATVVIKGTNNSSITDSGGHFTIRANPGTLIKFSSIGYQDHEIILGKGTELNITFSEAMVNLDEVVVIGYGTSRRKDLTGAIGTVSEKDFNRGIFTSPDQLIQGKVPGVQISFDNGDPGGAATLKIRGNSSLSGIGQPLYVIDGVLLDGRTLQLGVNPLNFINPDDIASIDILKDASATAIYGSRAAYGVVIINTRKAQAGQAKMNLAIATGVSSILKKVKLLNVSQFRDAIKYYGLSSADLDKGESVNAFDAILQNAVQQKYTAWVTGGNETGKYRLSANFISRDGIIINTGFKKYGMDLASNFKFLESKKLGLDINVNSSQCIQNVPLPEFGAWRLVVPALKWNPTASLRNADGSFNLTAGDNPVAITEMLKNNFKITTILASIAPYYKFTKWLEYKLLISINYSTGITRYSATQNLQSDPGGTATISNSELKTQQVTHTLNFNKKFFDELNVDAVCGFEYMQFTMKGSSLTGRGAQGIGFGTYGLDYTNYVQYSGTGNRSISSFIDPVTEVQSFFGRAIFNYKDKYLATGTFRADGSSKFGENNKYGYFPSFAIAWNITNEKFFKLHFVNSLKIRAGWGKTGNQEFPSGAANARYSFFDGGIIRQVNNPNPDLKWQSDKQYNIGFDFSILKNRISGTLDYFSKTTTDLLFPSPPIQPAPPLSVVRWINLDGNILNKGLEVLVNGIITRNGKFGWDLSLNATFLKNNVTGIPAPVYTGFVSGPVQVIQNGFPMQTFYTRKFLGLDKATGLSVYEDGDATFYYVGNPNPKTLLGLSSTFNYKKLSLTANMYGALGQDIFNVTLMNFINVGGIKGGNIGLSVYKEPVKESLANPVTPSSRFIMKGSYFKMANLTVAYAFGELAKVFKGVNLYVTAQNLFMITKYPGFDPEANSNASINNIPALGIDYPQYPSARTLTLGINFSL